MPVNAYNMWKKSPLEYSKRHSAGNPVNTIISCYSPTNATCEETAKTFYKDLKVAINEIPKHNFLFIGGDMNAKVGHSDGKYTFHEETNRNGEFLLNLINETGLVPINLKFQKHKGKLWTFTYPSGYHAQLDFILVRTKNSVRNIEAYSSFRSVGSDHRILTCCLVLSVRAPKKSTQKRTILDWKVLRSDAELQKIFTIAVKNRFSALSTNATDPNYSQKGNAEQRQQPCITINWLWT